ncbi:Copper amine oxidase, enzyme domain family protein [Candida albicans]|uniref:Amine oxidase n=1 Tax=Candida albicans TaxID=5476 RepID=A0A8H6F3D1_CANAX|nr:Copper amine oxidase, enzyme domain family protein [Candida albicans]
MERLSQLAIQTTNSSAAPAAPGHPLDPLSPAEIKSVSNIVKSKFPNKSISFNTVTLKEPIKRAYYEWKEKKGPLPSRLAYYVVVADGDSGVHEGFVDIGAQELIEIKHTEGVQPILTPHDLQVTEEIIRNDPEVQRQCELSGVPPNSMHQIYCDAWTIGYDERWGASRRLQQALMYWRSDEDDSQYSHPLDFCPIVDMNAKKVVFIDIPQRRRKVSKHKHSSFHPKHVADKYGSKENPSGYRQEDFPINITQPEGVSFKLDNHVMSWSNFNFHIGFNYREDFPHQRKHALDIGEYGADGHVVDRSGDAATIRNAICIHEEDDGVLFKHSDFRDDFQTTVTTRGKKLIISQIFTAANYEYCVYWILRQDGTIKLEIRLTGILNTYICADGEDIGPWGTVVYPNVNAHNHQHLFSLRIHPRIDGDNNSAATSDAKPSPFPTGSTQNMYGNAFYCEKTTFKTVKESITNFESATARTWDMYNPSSIHKYSGKPATYKLWSTFCSPLLAQEGSLVKKRAPWAASHTQVVPYVDDKLGYGRLYPSGDHVPQWSGDGLRGMREWIGDGTDKVDNTDILLFHTFGITHFPAPEDFPVMPTEIFDLQLRPRNIHTENPVLDVKPSYARTTSEVKAGAKGVDTCTLNVDKSSRLAFDDGSCCKK